VREASFSFSEASIQADFIGIDLTMSDRKPTAYAGLSTDLRLCCLGFWGSDDEIVDAIIKWQPRLVAIDAPLSLPEGMDCLEEDCSCQSLLPQKGRACERELARLGIPCYFTTKKSIIKEMVYRGINLKRELCRRGHEVIEVYPYASKVRLFGRPIPPKTSSRGLSFLGERLAGLIPDLAPHISKLNHDLCDALIASYTAYLHSQSETEAVGDPEEGLIWLPLKSF
jgi:predicted nuclease with RNAse H fold